MSVGVYDRWHKAHPKPDDTPCRCSRGKNKLYPSSDHGKGMRWQVRWIDKQGRNLRRNFAERYGDDPELHADAFAAQTKADLDADRYRNPKLATITLQEYAEKWHRNRPKGKFKTTKNRDDRLAYIYDLPTKPSESAMRRKSEGQVPPIAPRTLVYLAEHPSEIQEWISWMEELGLAPSTICNICRTLSSIFRAAIDDGIVRRDPTKADSVTWPNEKRPQIVPWTLAQVEAAAKDMIGRHERSGSIPYLGSGAGMRQGEIFGFGEGDVDFDKGVIHIRRQVKEIQHPKTGQNLLVFSLPKGDKTRDVPLSDDLDDRLRRQIKDFPPVEITLPWETFDGEATTVELLYVGFDGKAWLADTFNRRLWHPARQAAGAPATRHNGTHALRHTFASALLSFGVDIRTLSEFLGHSNAAITLKYYAHLMPNAAHRVRQALDAFFCDES